MTETFYLTVDVDEQAWSKWTGEETRHLRHGIKKFIADTLQLDLEREFGNTVEIGVVIR